MKIEISLIFTVLFIISCAGNKKAAPEAASSPETIGNEILNESIVIFNNSNNNKIFLLGHPSNLKEYTIKKKEVWISPKYLTNPHFKINTGTKTIHYKLLLTNKYMIFWNKTGKHWDLKKVETPN